jgi:RNA polymerase sporulation-specific sigma factor
LKTFEQPLSAEEETLYLSVMHGDDKAASHDARQILIERNLRLVAHVAKKYMGCGEDIEDLISIGTIGLIKAVNTFKPEKGSRLATYAAKCIDNELLMMFRARKKITREISLYEPIGTDKEGNEINLIDVCEQEQTDIIDDMDMAAKLQCLYTLINERRSGAVHYQAALRRA